MSAESARIVTASRTIAAPAAQIFELLADPETQLRVDGNNNLAKVTSGERVRAVGDVFVIELTSGESRENHVVEFEEGELIAWLPAPVGEQPRGHLWRWELEALDDDITRVTHTYDWTRLEDETRFPRALATNEDYLQNSLEVLERVAAGDRA